ncbi:MAG TPA: hypothetical protein PK254_06060 [Methanolinea sp.]|nr:hypothetical protein [Methanolinea sp.]
MMSGTVHSRFVSELRSFYLVTLLNVVFAALAVALGIQYIVLSINGLAGGQPVSLVRVATAAVSMVAFGLGISWITAGARIMGGLTSIRRACLSKEGPVPAEVTTSGIIRMIAHYRANKKTIRTMILVCTIGGFCFLALGIISSVEFFSMGLLSGTITLNTYSVLPAALFSLGIAIVSLVSSYYFMKFSKAWDLREDTLSRSEPELAEALERDPR